MQRSNPRTFTVPLALALATLSTGCGVAFPHEAEQEPAARLAGVPLLATGPTRHRARHYGVNPTVDTEEETLSAFGLDVDSGSWSLVREALGAGVLPAPESVRIESLVNAPGLVAPPPAPAEPGALGVDAEVFPSPFRPGYHALRLTVVAGPAWTAPRPRLVVAVSPPGATLAVATALSRAVANPENVSLVAGHDVDGALTRALDAVDAAPGPARLVLAGDGRGELTEALLSRLARHADSGAPTTVLALDVGRGLDDAALVAIAEAGGGQLVGHLGLTPARLAAAMRALVTPTASDVVARVRFRADAVARFRLLGYEHRTADGHRPLRGALLGAGEAVTALYEIRLREGTGPLAAIELGWRRGASGSRASHRVSLGRDRVRARITDVTPGSRLALAAAACAEKLRGSFWARHLRWQDVTAELEAVGGSSVTGTELALLAARAAALAPDRDPLRVATNPGGDARVGALPILAPATGGAP